MSKNKQNKEPIQKRDVAALAAILKNSAGFMRDKRKRREKEKNSKIKDSWDF